MKYKIKYTNRDGNIEYIYAGKIWDTFEEVAAYMRDLNQYHHPPIYSLAPQPDKIVPINPLLKWLRS